jgi:hypothetical protein
MVTIILILLLIANLCITYKQEKDLEIIKKSYFQITEILIQLSDNDKILEGMINEKTKSINI